jgi:hypothetical protein
VIRRNKENCDWSGIGSTCDTVHIGSCAFLLRACDVMQEARVVIERALGQGDVLVHQAVLAETKKKWSEVTKKQVKYSSVCDIYLCRTRWRTGFYTCMCRTFCNLIPIKCWQPVSSSPKCITVTSALASSN